MSPSCKNLALAIQAKLKTSSLSYFTKTALKDSAQMVWPKFWRIRGLKASIFASMKPTRSFPRSNLIWARTSSIQSRLVMSLICKTHSYPKNPWKLLRITNQPSMGSVNRRSGSDVIPLISAFKSVWHHPQFKTSVYYLINNLNKFGS